MSSKRPNTAKARTDARRTAPQLWADGRQQPPFDLRGYVRVSLLLSRRMARPLLLVTARMVTAAAMRVAVSTSGPRLAQALRLARALPSRETVARGLQAAAGFLSAAADAAAPPEASAAVPRTDHSAVLPEPHGLAGPIRPRQPIARPRKPAPRLAEPQSQPPDGPPKATPDPGPEPAPSPQGTEDAEDADLDRPTIAAIRAMIAEMGDIRPSAPAVTPVRPRPVAQTPPPPPATGRLLLAQNVPLAPPEPGKPTLRDAVARRVFGTATGAVAVAVTGLALPVGLVLAAAKHLAGNDLRTWS